MNKKQLEKEIKEERIFITMDYSAYRFQEHELNSIEKDNLLKLFKQFKDMFFITSESTFNTIDCYYKIIKE